MVCYVVGSTTATTPGACGEVGQKGAGVLGGPAGSVKREEPGWEWYRAGTVTCTSPAHNADRESQVLLLLSPQHMAGLPEVTGDVARLLPSLHVVLRGWVGRQELSCC